LFLCFWEKKNSKDLGLSRKLMGILLVLMPTMSFLGGLFWSVIVDRTGSYRGVLTTTSLLGVTTIFGYLLPQAATSFSAV
jgi:cyanate permease